MNTRNALRRGFTLVEMLVTLILLGILVAVVFPVVTQQIDDADPTKAANDLANIRTGLEIFHLNVRPTYTQDLEDLIHEIDTSDAYFASSTTTNSNYTSSQVSNWNGPYIDKSVTETSTGSGDAFETGYGGNIQFDLVQFDADNNQVWDGTGSPALFLAVQVHDLDATQAGNIDELIDGTNNASAGQVRFVSSVLYYLAVPLK